MRRTRAARSPRPQKNCRGAGAEAPAKRRARKRGENRTGQRQERSSRTRPGAPHLIRRRHRRTPNHKRRQGRGKKEGAGKRRGRFPKGEKKGGKRPQQIRAVSPFCRPQWRNRGRITKAQGGASGTGRSGARTRRAEQRRDFSRRALICPVYATVFFARLICATYCHKIITKLSQDLSCYVCPSVIK